MRARIYCSAVLIGVLSASSVPAAQYDDLLKLIPESANAVVLIDVTAVQNSPLAVRENWKQMHERAYVDRPFVLPPEAKRIVLAAQLNPQDEFKSNWEVAVMDLSEDVSIKSIARAEGGYVDQLGGVQAAWTPSDAYFIQFGPRQLGMMHPASRQMASRWAESVSRRTGAVLAPYLQSAATTAATKQIVLSLDLRNVVQPHRIRERMENDMPASLKGQNVNPQRLTDVMSSLEGITLSVQITDKAQGKIRVDFGDDTASIAKVAKPLLLEVLSDLGAKIEVLQNWKATVEPRAIVMEGELTSDAMRRIFSILELPSTKFATVDQASTGAATTGPTAKASKQYFDSIIVLIEDLRKTLDQGAANSTVWMERYAQKIDRLPILHVDNDLLAYGASVAEQFREMSMAKKAAGVRNGVRRSNTYGDYSYTGADGGIYSTGVPSKEYSRIRTEENARATGVRMNTWKSIDDETPKIRKTMTQRYNVEF